MSDNIVSPTDNSNSATARAASRRINWMRWVGVLFISAALLALYYGLIILFGWRSGESIRLNQIEQNRIASISRQKELAIQDINQNRYDLAMRRLDYILVQSPNDTEIVALRQEAENAINILLTPSPTVTPTPSSTPTVTPTPTLPPPTADATAAHQTMVDAYDTLQAQLLDNPTDYEVNIRQLEQFRASYSSYNRRIIDEQLYDTYIALGQQLTRTTEIEKGLGYLYQARTLGDLPEEVVGEIFWAEQYLEGIVYFGINWNTYLSYFRPLCSNVPLFQDSCTKLQIGLVNSANIALAEDDWCLAEALYDEAISVGSYVEGFDVDIETVREMCALVTPEPGTGTPGTQPDISLDGTPTPDNRNFPIRTPTPYAP